ncbi:FAD-dependent oxidoreductase, partial [Mailhella massiliensis]
QILRDAFAEACEGRGESVDWDMVRRVAVQMHESALCGVGRTGVVPVLGALEHFSHLLKTSAPVQDALSSYSVTTAPCIEACPAHVDIPRYIDAIRDDRPERAVEAVSEHYPLVGSCGRVCARPCESACTRNSIEDPVSIRSIKRYAADHASAEPGASVSAPEGPAEVAVVGAGPAGWTCAYHVLRAGHSVDIFDAEAVPGGMIRYGIPSYRLPKDLLDMESSLIQKLGGRLFRASLGRDISLSGLQEKGYKAVFVGIGASMGQLAHLPEDKNPPEGYENGIDFLRRVHDGVAAGNPPALHGDVVVVGGGNVAMDCCRSATRLTDGKVRVLYRRTEQDLPADREEIEDAVKEGVIFHFLSNPCGLETADGRLTGVRVLKMRQGDPDASGRRSVSPVEGSEWVLPCSHIIAAIGQRVRSDDIPEDEGIARGRNGVIIVDNNFATSRDGVFSGGDCVSGPDTLINAMSQGEQAAHSIVARLEGCDPFSPRRRMSELLKAASLMDPRHDWEPSFPRQRTPSIPVEQRRSFAEVEHTLRPGAARAEADRCLRCYRLFTVLTASPIPNAD